MRRSSASSLLGGYRVGITLSCIILLVGVVFAPLAVAAANVDLVAVKIAPLATGPICAGSNPTLRAYIQNKGTTASGSFNIRWIADGRTYDGGHNSIAPGATDTHDHIWSQGPEPAPLAQGTHYVLFTVDFDNAVPETNENNNQVIYSFNAITCGSTQPPDWLSQLQTRVDQFFNWLNLCVNDQIPNDPGCKEVARVRSGVTINPASIASCVKSLGNRYLLGWCITGKIWGLWLYWSEHYK